MSPVNLFMSLVIHLTEKNYVSFLGSVIQTGDSFWWEWLLSFPRISMAESRIATIPEKHFVLFRCYTHKN